MSLRRPFVLYGTVAALFGLVLGWWLVFFARQGERLVRLLEQAGVGLTEEQTARVREAASRSLRMFAFEGAFLGLLAVVGFLLILRSMRREIELHRGQRDFLSAITHELRSPIASARLHVESLALGRVPEAKRARYHEHALEDLDRLGRTVDQLLTAARASSGRVALELEPIELTAFTRRVVERLGSLAAEGKASIEVLAGEPVHVSADAEALDTIVENLVSNALKYGGEPARVEVSVQRAGREAVLCVRDHGPGLAEDRSRSVFDPFVRGGSELVDRRPGVGLGLYLVAEMTRALGGTVRAANADGGGLEVRVALEAEEVVA